MLLAQPFISDNQSDHCVSMCGDCFSRHLPTFFTDLERSDRSDKRDEDGNLDRSIDGFACEGRGWGLCANASGRSGHKFNFNFFSDFSQSRIGVECGVFNKRIIKVCFSC